MMSELNDRMRQILKLVVDAYVATGEPVGSMAVSQKLGMKLSPATIRNAMAELEERGLLYAPHTSAGRLPTDNGFAVFVEGLLELDHLTETERDAIEQKIESARKTSLTDMLEQTSGFLSGLSGCAGLVFAPKSEDALSQIEFLQLSQGRVLAVIVGKSGMVENRLLEVPAAIDFPTLNRAANYMNAKLAGKTLAQAAEHISRDLSSDRLQLDALTAKLVEQGIACLGAPGRQGQLFIKGQANLLSDISAVADIERVRQLFETLEAKEEMLQLLQATSQGDGVRIFIGAENTLFSHSGCSLIVAPYKNAATNVVGAIGVIGPTRLNYGRIIPVVNYTSQIIGRAIG